MSKFRGPTFWEDSQKDNKVVEEPQGFWRHNIPLSPHDTQWGWRKIFRHWLLICEDNFYET